MDKSKINYCYEFLLSLLYLLILKHTIWKPSSLSELTPILFCIELTQLDFEASISSYITNGSLQDRVIQLNAI